MSKKIIFAALLMFPALALAQNVPDFSAFRYYKNVTPAITKTSVIEVPFNQESFSVPVFGVYNLTTSEFEPSLLSINKLETKVDIEAYETVNHPWSLAVDGNYETYLEFPVTQNSNKASILFGFEKPITTSSLFLALDKYVALPTKITIEATVAGKNVVVLAPTQLGGSNVVFPKTTSSSWEVDLEYVQPLRISEIKFNDLSATETTRGLRFLAQPGQSYRIYFDADRYVVPSNKEAGNLFSSAEIIYSNALPAVANPEYKPADSDADSVPDLADNCTSVPNKDQKDEDRNGRGDACEDYDRDGIYNSKDNCAELPNGAQIDTDADGIGDICDDKDNRVTERLPWLPWAGIGLAGVVVFGLFVMVLGKKNVTIQKDY